MSLFSDQFTVAAPVLFGSLGDTVTYTPAGGTGKTISAIPGQIRTEEHEMGTGLTDGMGRKRYRTYAIASDATIGVAAPAENDTITHGGQTWVVSQIEMTGGLVWRLICMLDQQVDQIGLRTAMLRHSCAVYREASTGTDGINQPVMAASLVTLAQPCNFWQQRREEIGEEIQYTIGRPKMVVPAGANIKIRDRIENVILASSGVVVAAGPFVVAQAFYDRIEANRLEVELESMEN